MTLTVDFERHGHILSLVVDKVCVPYQNQEYENLQLLFARCSDFGAFAQ